MIGVVLPTMSVVSEGDTISSEVGDGVKGGLESFASMGSTDGVMTSRGVMVDSLECVEGPDS